MVLLHSFILILSIVLYKKYGKSIAGIPFCIICWAQTVNILYSPEEGLIEKKLMVVNNKVLVKLGKVDN